jgi:phage terminase small subunit
MSKKTNTPAGLSAESKRLWQRISAEYNLSAEHESILLVACQQFDSAQAARAQIKLDGMIVNGRRHPLIGVEAKAAELFMRAIRDLGLEAVVDG